MNHAKDRIGSLRGGFAVSAFVVFAIILSAAFSPTLVAQDFDFARLNDRAQEHTVIVKATVSMSMGNEPFETKVRGIGVLVTEDGLVIVNASLIDFGSGMPAYFGVSGGFDVFNLTVSTLSGESYGAEWLGIDRLTGVGFLRVRDPESPKFKPISFSTRKSYSVGEWVALFYLLPDYVEPPLGADIGMITALLTEPERAPLVIGFSETQINSALYDQQGRAIGILSEVANPRNAAEFIDPSAYLSSLGGGMGAYPMLGILSPERLKPLIENPPKPGKKHRGWLGVSYQALNEEIAEYWGLDIEGGVIINEVVKNSPADKAGVLVGDILYAINDEPLKVTREENVGIFSRRIGEFGPGSVTELQALRADESGEFHKVDLIAELVEAPITSAEADTYDDERFDFKARNLVFNDYLYYNLDQDEFQGVWVSEVQSGGWAELGGLFPGDIVQLVNGVAVSTVLELESEMRQIAEQKLSEVIFFVWRDNKTLFVNIKPDWSDDS